MPRPSSIVIALLALLHVYILVLEMFFWESPTSLRAFGLTPELAQATVAMGANQGLYNGFLAAGLAWGLTLGVAGRSIKVFFLLFFPSIQFILSLMTVFTYDITSLVDRLTCWN